MRDIEEIRESIISDIETYSQIKGNKELCQDWIRIAKNEIDIRALECMEQCLDSLWDY
jgi:hypothetical protein